MFAVTLVSSVAFILHCGFIIVLVALPSPNIDFSFAGLLVTEILPSIFILITFELLQRSGIGKLFTPNFLNSIKSVKMIRITNGSSKRWSYGSSRDVHKVSLKQQRV